MSLESSLHTYHHLAHKAKWSRQHTIPTIGALTGMSSGWVLPLVSTNLLAWWSTTGGSIHSSGWLCLLGVPLSLRCFWAPLLDKHCFPWLDVRRSWAVVAQIAVVLALMLVGGIEAWGVNHPAAVSIQLFGFLVISLAGGTLRSALDAYIVDVAEHEDHGTMAQWNVMFFRAALFLMSGVALWVAEVLGWSSMFIGSGLVMLLMAYGVMHLPSVKHKYQPPVDRPKLFSWNTFIPRGEGVGWLVWLMLWCIGLSFIWLLGMVFLLKDLGMRLSEAGLINNIMGLSVGIVGGVITPSLLRWLKPVPWIALLLVLQVLVVFSYVELSKHTGMVGMWTVAGVVCLSNLVLSGLMATLVMVLMERCDPENLPSQYAFGYSFPSTLICLLGPVAGTWVTHYGWTSWFNVVLVASFIPFFVTPWSKLRTILAPYCK